MNIELSKFIWFILILANLSCQNKENKGVVNKRQSYMKDSFYLKIDEYIFYNKRTKLVYDNSFIPKFQSDYKKTGDKLTIDSMIRFHYRSYYFGNEFKFFDAFKSYDSLSIPVYFEKYRYLKNSKLSESDFDKTPKPELEIFVDTTQYLKLSKDYYPKIPKGDEYVVYLINKSNLYYFSWFDLMSFTILMQAYNKENKRWQPIEYQNSHSGFYMLIHPKSYIVTSALVYDGDYSTKLRLKFKNGSNITYSNEFSGKIKKSQFDTIPNVRSSLVVYHF